MTQENGPDLSLNAYLEYQRYIGNELGDLVGQWHYRDVEFPWGKDDETIKKYLNDLANNSDDKHKDLVEQLLSEFRYSSKRTFRWYLSGIYKIKLTNSSQCDNVLNILTHSYHFPSTTFQFDPKNEGSTVRANFSTWEDKQRFEELRKNPPDNLQGFFA